MIARKPYTPLEGGNRPLKEALQPILDRHRDCFVSLLQRFDSSLEMSSVLESLFETLLQRLFRTMARPLVLELNLARINGELTGKNSRERYNSFIIDCDERPERLWGMTHRYPELKNIIRKTIGQFLQSTSELLHRYESDSPLIAETFGIGQSRIVKIVGDLGDSHRRGRSVSCLEFDTGSRIIYKPKPLSVDLHFQGILAWLNSRGWRPHFRLTRVSNRGHYGWTEYLERKECRRREELERYYVRGGGLLCLIFALDGRDCHMENVIAHGENPVIVDFEGLFSRGSWRSLTESQTRLTELCVTKELETPLENLLDSVLATGLLPQWMLVPRKERSDHDISGFFGHSGRALVRLFYKEASDRMREVFAMKTVSYKENLPKNGIDPTYYADEIITGFARMWRLIHCYRKELVDLVHGFGSDNIRCLFRPTRAYSGLLDLSYYPEVLRRPRYRRRAIEQMLRRHTSSHSLMRLIPSEVDDLVLGDIPIFTTTAWSLNCHDSKHNGIRHFFREPSMSFVRKRLRNWNAEALEKEIMYIRKSIIGYRDLRSKVVPKTSLV